MKSDKKKTYLATCKIDLVPPHRRHRSITAGKPSGAPKLNVNSFGEESDSDPDPDYCDEYEESLGDSTEPKGRQSIAEMVTMHKLNTTKTIVKTDSVSEWFLGNLIICLDDSK